MVRSRKSPPSYHTKFGKDLKDLKKGLKELEITRAGGKAGKARRYTSGGITRTVRAK